MCIRDRNFSNSLSSEFKYGDDGEVYLPLANGRSLKFTFFERSNFAPELALKYPGIKAFRGYSTEYPQIIAYLSSSPLGLDATVINTESGKRTTFMKYQEMIGVMFPTQSLITLKIMKS